MEQKLLLKLIDKYAQLSSGEITNDQERSDQYLIFYHRFTNELRAIINEMSGEIRTLKERHFDQKMLKLMISIHEKLKEIAQEIKPNKPFIAAEKFVNFVLEKPFNMVLNNLEFLAKHHINDTNIKHKPISFLANPEIRVFENIKNLAIKIKKDIEYEISSNAVPVANQIPEDVPYMPANQNDKTFGGNGTLVSKK